MNTLVVFDSAAGNTERIANTIAAGIGPSAKAIRINSPEAIQLEKTSLLIVGSPTYGGRPTEGMLKYLNGLSLPSKTLKVATFDTRLKMKLTKLFGYAADKMETHFKEKGIMIKGKPEGFIVKGRNGPLSEGELERANS